MTDFNSKGCKDQLIYLNLMMWQQDKQPEGADESELLWQFILS